MTRRPAHEQLNHPLGLGCVVQADRLACRIRGCKGTVAPKHSGQRDTTESAAGAPKEFTSAMRLAKRLV